MNIHKWLVVSFLLLALTPFAALAQTGPTVYSASDINWYFTAPVNWVGDQQNPQMFLNVAADEDGQQLFVANYGSVLIFDAETGELDGSIVDASGTVVQVDDVAPAGEGNVWVADSKTFNVFLVDPTGSILQTISPITPDNQNAKLAPNELEVGPDGNLFVLYSSTNTLMQVFTPDGEFVRSFTMGDRSLSSGLIDFAFGPDGNLYIAGNGTVRILNTEGTIVVKTFAQDSLEGDAFSIRGIAVDAEGNVYVGSSSEGEALTSAVYKFDADGQLLAQFGIGQQRIDWGSAFKPEELGFTVSLALLPEGQLVISDANSAFVQLLRVDMTG